MQASQLDVENCDRPLVLSTPMGGLSEVNLIYKMCQLFIGEYRFSADLFVLPMSEFDVILGMDWLTKYQATVDCYRRRVILRKKHGQAVEFQAKHGRFVFPPVLKSLLGGRRNLEGMGMLFALDGEIEGGSEDAFISVVSEFLDVFPPELSGLSPKREIEFCIASFLERLPSQ